jgi:hypothetical protein
MQPQVYDLSYAQLAHRLMSRVHYVHAVRYTRVDAHETCSGSRKLPRVPRRQSFDENEYFIVQVKRVTPCVPGFTSGVSQLGWESARGIFPLSLRDMYVVILYTCAHALVIRDTEGHPLFAHYRHTCPGHANTSKGHEDP